MAHYVGLDIGGTFTDCAVLDEHGHVVTTAKSPSVPWDPGQGVIGALEIAASNLGIPTGQFLARASLIIHGCTVGTNAMIERKGARVDSVIRGFGIASRHCEESFQLEKDDDAIYRPRYRPENASPSLRSGLRLTPLAMTRGPRYSPNGELAELGLTDYGGWSVLDVARRQWYTAPHISFNSQAASAGPFSSVLPQRSECNRGLG